MLLRHLGAHGKVGDEDVRLGVAQNGGHIDGTVVPVPSTITTMPAALPVASTNPTPTITETPASVAKPVIVAGDFNTYWGDHEIYLFNQAAGLTSANVRSLPSYPSHSPRKELDFILCSAEIQVDRFDIPDIRLSDHRPLICDFTVRAEARRAA